NLWRRYQNKLMKPHPGPRCSRVVPLRRSNHLLPAWAGINLSHVAAVRSWQQFHLAFHVSGFPKEGWWAISQ
ncbi:MAG: hypothetical protein ACPL7D_13570, partial [Candidatus Sumerlaeaceae bacterium]